MTESRASGEEIAMELDTYNALTARAADARGDLAVVVKDNIAVAGFPTRAASPALPDAPATADAPVVAALREAGATVVGTANMHELALGVTSDNAFTGRVDNPVAPGHVAGGSSGGTAAAIAAGLAQAGLGTDTGGSVRVPAAFCGIAGLRPTPGRYPSRNVVPLSTTLDTVGPMGPDVATLARLDAALTRRPHLPPREPELRGLRLGIPRAYFYDDLEPAVARAIDGVLARLADAGCLLVEAEVPDVEALVGAAHEVIAFREIADALTEVASTRAGIPLAEFAQRIASADVRDTVDALAHGAAPSARAYEQAHGVIRRQLQGNYAGLFAANRLAALVIPCTPIVPPLAEPDPLHRQSRDLFPLLTRNPLGASVAGLPSLCLPVAAPGELPVGVLLDAPAGHDLELLAIGAAVERLLRAP